MNAPIGPLPGREPLVTYAWREDVPLEDELLTALEDAGVEFEDETRPLESFLDADGLASLQWVNHSLTVHTSAWGYPISLTPNRIIVWEPK